ncbi:hypothetical protein BK816_03980 [Boudabousia tangfeifanii]|uniref:Peptidylprolyl isomerase n=2 Tax=Boudabousia tangfeifanii TaxID=1912795 RepID=A0A1D9MK12_9ACTO|nr:hypothetical protein BK816_03980 [Boudabousia tangfeifanii]
MGSEREEATSLNEVEAVGETSDRFPKRVRRRSHSSQAVNMNQLEKAVQAETSSPDSTHFSSKVDGKGTDQTSIDATTASAEARVAEATEISERDFSWNGLKATTKQGLSDAKLYIKRNPKRVVFALVAMLLMLMVLAALVFSFRSLAAKQEQEPVTLSATFSGRLGQTVTLKLPEEITPLEYGKFVTIKGGGKELAIGAPALLAVSTFDGRSGAPTGASTSPLMLLGALDANLTGEQLAQQLVGIKEGSRVVFVRPLSNEKNPPLELVVVDVLSTVATGHSQPLPKNAGAWVTEKDGVPVVTEIKSQNAKEPWGAVVMRGNGDQVGENDTIIAQFLKVNALNGQVEESTWEAGGMPMKVKLSEIMKPLAAELTDQKVGSRIITTIPAASSDGTNPIVVVVDILAILNQEK